jgi:hypothetical protein
MKTLMASIVILLFICIPLVVCAQQQSQNLIKNGDFEKFTGDNPDSWDTSNIPGTLTVVSPSRICYAGQRAVRCEVKDFFGSFIAGYVCQKNIQTGGRDVRLTGRFLVHSLGKDEGVIVLCFQNEGGSTVGTMEEYLEDTNSKFAEFVKEFKAPAGATSVQIRLTILPVKESEKTHPGTYFICDDLKLAALAPKEKQLIQ